MGSKLYVDKDYNEVAEGSPDAAFVWDQADADRLAKFQKRANPAGAKAKAKAAPPDDEDDGSVEKVSRPKAVK